MEQLLDPIALITTGAIVIFLTQQAKRWVATDFLPLIAVVIGVAIQLVNDWALAAEPLAKGDWWTTIVVGAGVGMAAAGVYDLAGRTSTEIPPAELNVDDSWLLEAEAPPIWGAEDGVVPEHGEDLTPTP